MQTNGKDIFRFKGIINISGDSNFYVLQAVHELIDFRPDHQWGDSEPYSKLVFIGRNLEQMGIEVELKQCFAEPGAH